MREEEGLAEALGVFVELALCVVKFQGPEGVAITEGETPDVVETDWDTL